MTDTTSSPTITLVTPSVVEQDQNTVIADVVPGLSGDLLTLTQTSGVGTLSLGPVQSDGTQQVIYTAPALISASTGDAVGFAVNENGQTATGSASVQLDMGPSIASEALPAVEEGQTTVIGTVTPGLPGDTLTLTQTAGAGTLGLGPVQADGAQQVIYTAPISVASSTIDAMGYTVSDQHNDVVASNTQDVLVDPGPPPALGLAAGAVAWWTLNTINGAVALDAIGGNNGVVVGATRTPGEVGGGLSFNGVSDFVSVPDSSAFDFGSGDFTLDCWANFAGPPSGSFGHPEVFISQDEGAGSQNKWIFGLYPGTLELILYNPTDGAQFLTNIPFNPTPGQWYNIAVTKSGSQYSFYVNGALAGTDTGAGSIPDITAPVTIGVSGEAYGGYFDGDLAQVGIFNRALSPTEVQQIYQAGLTAPLPTSSPTSLQLSTNQAGDTGPFTLSISSTEPVFEAGATVTLSETGEPSVVSTSTTVNATASGLAATFDLSGQPDGSYTVTVTNPDGSAYTAASALQIQPVSTPSLWAEIIGPTGLRAGYPESFAIEYGNSGNIDANNAVIQLVTDPGVGLTVHGTAAALQYNVVDVTASESESVQVFQISVPNVPAGSVNVVPFTVETDGSSGSIQLGAAISPPTTLGTLEQNLASTGSATIDWSSLESAFKSPAIDSTDWNLIWKRYETDVGNTTASFAAALSGLATTQSQTDSGVVGPEQILVTTLQTEILEQAAGILPDITLDDTTDLAPPGTGLDLSLTRTYSASFLNRNNPGSFGDGWTFTYGISATTDASGNVYISSPSGVELFTLQSSGAYAAQAGDPSTLTSSGGAYVLTEINGTVESFLTDGQIGSITDSNGNTIDISYGGNGVISGVTDSNGQSLTFTTNAQGRITSATDNDGQTTSYTYDASGDFLLSASGPGGVTSYSYAPSGNAFVQNALTQITYPDGTTETFQYDSQGDLTSESGAGGAGQVTFGYPATGAFTATDAAGNTASLVFGTNGNLEKLTDPLGNVAQLQYNSTNELTGVTLPTGATYALSYDISGNVTGYTDPDGGTVSATYAPGTDQLTSFTDQNGNTTSYSYNSGGDLTGVTYDDRSGDTYEYSSNGLLTSSTDARGQTTTYTYNAQGQLTGETFSDGTSQAYSYNSQGELISAQATDGGVTTYTYNPAGDLTSVTNPAGQVESYTYNSGGQEATRTEPDGSGTQYSYNAAGEVAKIADGSGNLITQYSYNALGELVGSLDGNGQTASYSYDADGDVTQILTKAADGSVTSQLNYTYNADGEPITATSLDGTWTYTYDASGQITNAVFASTNTSIANQNLTYEYDAAGNRTETIFNGAVNNYTTNGLNEYTASDGTTYSYDADGNLVSKTQSGVTTTYTYNSQNQLTAENGPSGDFTYTYDALGNLVSSTDNGVVSNYIIDPLAISTSATGPLSAIAQAYDAAGNVTATYDYGDGLAAQINGSGIDYYNTDATGNVTSLSGAGGSLVDTYDYTPFGTLLASTGAVANPFQYAGGWGITTGADGLVDMRARYYDPTQARFVSQDPIGIAGGANLYTFSNNDSLVFVDPTGLDDFEERKSDLILEGAGVEAEIIKLLLTVPVPWYFKAALLPPALLLGYGLFKASQSNSQQPSTVASPSNVPPAEPQNPFSPGLPPITVPPLTPPDDPFGPLPTIPLPTIPTIPYPVVSSSDPNDISGPQGVGATQFVNDTTPLGYQITFENLATATAPAQTVVVTDQLDPTKVNLSTFALGPITFGNEILTPPAASSSYSTVVNLQPANDLLVEVNAGLNKTTGLVTWTFTSLDPTTGQPTTNPLAGFLPPDVLPPEGDGSVFFSVQQDNGLATGTQVTNSATITFDANQPIATSVWSNTIDTTPPSSTVQSLPTTEQSASFLVQWSGSDPLVGIANYSIYDSDGGGPWTLWLQNTTETSATFQGESGHTYGFYSVATDNVGNVQATPTSAEATTTVSTATVDPGPTAADGAVTEGHGATVDLTALINGLVTPGLPGDVDTITGATAKFGAVTLSNGDVTYTAPASGSDTIAYTVENQLDQTATGSVQITVDPGPSIAAETPSSLEQGQTTVIGAVTPGLKGDTLTLKQTGGLGTLALGPVQEDGAQQVIYTAPSTVNSSTEDFVAYSISDQYMDVAQTTADVQLDAGPAISAMTPSVVEKGQSIEIGTVTPGLPGDTLTLTQTGQTAGGTVSLQLVGGVEEVIYTAPGNVGASTQDAVSYTVSDQHNDAVAASLASVQLDAGPAISAVTPSVVEKGQSTEIGTVTPGLPGDTLTLTQTGQTAGGTVSLQLVGGVEEVIYTAPGNVGASTQDAVSYTVSDQHNDAVAASLASVQLDAGPAISAVTPSVVEKGQSTEIGTVTPGLPGDTLTLTQTGQTAGGTVSLQLVGGVEEVIYTAPGNVGASAQDTVSYTISDQHDDAVAAATATIMFGIGPTLIPEAPPESSLLAKHPVAIGSIQPGPSSATLNLTVLSAPKDGAVSLVGDQVDYTPASSPRLGAQPDTFTYEVTDNHGDVTPVGTAILAGNGSYTESGGNAGYSSVVLGSGVDTVLLNGSWNAVSLGDGSDRVSGGQGHTSVTVGNGSDRISLGGVDNNIVGGSGIDVVSAGVSGNTVSLGNGVDTVSASGGGNIIKVGNGIDHIQVGGQGNQISLGSGIDNVEGGANDSVRLIGSEGDLIISGQDETVFLGNGVDIVTDSGLGLHLMIGPTASHDVVENFASDLNGGVFDLLGGTGGYSSATLAYQSLRNDGHGGSLLPLGQGTSLDITGVAPNHLSAANFKIG